MKKIHFKNLSDFATGAEHGVKNMLKGHVEFIYGATTVGSSAALLYLTGNSDKSLHLLFGYGIAEGVRKLFLYDKVGYSFDPERVRVRLYPNLMRFIQIFESAGAGVGWEMTEHWPVTGHIIKNYIPVGNLNGLDTLLDVISTAAGGLVSVMVRYKEQNRISENCRKEIKWPENRKY